jgi:hypothetical protein
MHDRALRSRPAALAVLLTCGLFVATDANAPTRGHDPGSFTVHEWGTFTSIAGADGGAVAWTPLNGQDDLPCFVRRLQFGPKWSLWGTVRMETPVLYFYAPNEVTVDVAVRFHQGVITEWFPQATVTPSRLPETPADMRRLADRVGTAAWTRVKVRPGAAPDFPREDAPSHYYPARETDAAPVQIGDAVERFLFYRGVGEFAPPVDALVEADGRIVVRARSGAPLGDIIVFDNRGGTVRYVAHSVPGQQTTIDPKLLEQRAAGSLNEHLERVLIAHGLYPKEARAMIATWRDTWFEEGARLFYIAPQRAVDAVLPLAFTPRPAAVARVFVGRIELMTPQTVTDVKSGFLRNDQAALAKYGRFLEPFMDRVFAESSATERTMMEPARQIFYRNWRPPLSACR